MGKLRDLLDIIDQSRRALHVTLRFYLTLLMVCFVRANSYLFIYQIKGLRKT